MNENIVRGKACGFAGKEGKDLSRLFARVGPGAGPDGKNLVPTGSSLFVHAFTSIFHSRSSFFLSFLSCFTFFDHSLHYSLALLNAYTATVTEYVQLLRVTEYVRLLRELSVLPQTVIWK